MARVKICGITNLKDALEAVDCGASAVGFIFYRKSPRYIHPSKAKKIIDQLPPFVASVGVFVNEKEKDVERIAQSCGLQALQFHGDETPSFCRKFKNYQVIKAFRVEDKTSLSQARQYDVDAVLVDTFADGQWGGTGQTFNWAVLKRTKFKQPLILSGGLNPKNVKRAITSIKPYGVDVSSGVEASPGRKDKRLLRTLFRNIEDI